MSVFRRRRRGESTVPAEGDGWHLETTRDGIDLVVTDEWSAEARDAILDGRADGLVLNYARGFRGADIAFIEGLPLRRLQVLVWTLDDLGPIHTLGDTLVMLDVSAAPGTVIDLAAFPRLEGLGADWEQVRRSIDAIDTISDLYLGHYRAPDLTPLSRFRGLRRLSMKDYPSVRSLHGVGELKELRDLGIYLARLLVDITELSALDGGPLTRLELPSCSKIADLEPMSGLKTIEHLDLGDCREIASVKPLSGFDALSWLDLYGTTTIADGDLRPLMELPALRRLGLANRRHYRPTVAEVQARMAERGVAHDGPEIA